MLPRLSQDLHRIAESCGVSNIDVDIYISGSLDKRITHEPLQLRTVIAGSVVIESRWIIFPAGELKAVG